MEGNVGATDGALVPPPADAPITELMKYNFKKMQHAVFGESPEQATVNKKLLFNGTCFLASVVGIVKFGDKLVWD